MNLIRYTNNELINLLQNDDNMMTKLNEIYYESYNDDPEYLEWDFKKQIDKTYDTSHVSAEIRDRCEYIICFNENDITGFVIFYEEQDMISIMLLCVGAKYRNQKIGTYMLNHMMTYNKKISLEVWRWNTKAIRFYERHGFKCVRSYFDTAIVDVYEFIL